MDTQINSIKHKLPVSLIIWTALLAGTLDICAAFINSYLRSGVSPFTVLRFIASGLLGDQAFTGGLLTALLGLLFHFFIAFSWTLIFFFAYPKLKIKSNHKIVAGLIYGVIIWLIMNLIVLPVSNTPAFKQSFLQILVGISFIMFLIGLPISLIFHKYEESRLIKF